MLIVAAGGSPLYAQSADSSAPPPSRGLSDAVTGLPYSYPFDSPDTAQKLSSIPMVVELYSSLDCLFCPRAERLLSDLIQKTRLIAFACHTDDEGAAYPLAREFCSSRQDTYSTHLTDGLLYTPQMVINGHIDAVGHEFDDVRAGFKKAVSDPPIHLTPRPANETGIYLVDLPTTKIKSPANLILITYRPPYTVPKTMRQSRMRPEPLVHVAESLALLGSWDGREKTLTVSFTTNEKAAGFVILAQQDNGQIVAAGEMAGTPP